MKRLFLFFTMAVMCNSMGFAQSVFDMPQLFPKHLSTLQTFIQTVQRKDFLAAEKAALEGVKLFPNDANWHYNVACIYVYQQRYKEAMEWLTLAVDRGYYHVNQMRKDPDLAPLREGKETKEAFLALVRRVEEIATKPQQNATLQRACVEPVKTGDEFSVTPKNTQWEWDPQQGGFMTTLVRLLPREEVPAYTGPYADIVAPWSKEALEKEGIRAHYNLLYVNRDEDLSQPNVNGNPFVNLVVYGNEAMKSKAHIGPANGRFSSGLIDIPVIGSSTTFFQKLPFWRSVPRFIATNGPMTALAYRLAFSNQLYIYDATADISMKFRGDILTAMQPFYMVTADTTLPPFNGPLNGVKAQEEIVELAFAAVEAMRPETRNAMFKSKRFVWTMQRLFREAQRDAKGILDPKAHPVAFNLAQIDAKQLLERAHAMTPEMLPPMFAIRMRREDRPIQYVDYFDPTNSELYADTSMSISRIVRGRDYTRTMTIEAMGEAGLRYHWFVVNGLEDKIRIKPLTSDGSITTIEVDWHGVYSTPNGTSIRRVDIACVATRADGVSSAPAFVSLRYLANEQRTYKDGVLTAIDYTPSANGFVYEDPAITTHKNWKDIFNYDGNGRCLGWTRYAPMKAPETFTEQGLRLIGADDTHASHIAEPVIYQPRINPRSDGLSAPAIELLQFQPPKK